MAARSKAWAYGRSLAGIAGSNSGRDMDISLVSVVCCQVEVLATGRSFAQRSPTSSGVSECVIEEPHRGVLGALGLSIREGKKYNVACYPYGELRYSV